MKVFCKSLKGRGAQAGLGIVPLLLIVAVLVVAGVAGKSHLDKKAIETARQERLEKARESIRALLKDPASAQFEEVKLNTETNGVCGRVNAKNAYGGYVGFVPFIVDASGNAMLAPLDAARMGDEGFKKLEEFLQIQTSVCKNKAV